MVLRTTQEYVKLGAEPLGTSDSPYAATALPPFRTHHEDPDPVVAVFREAITPEEAAHLVEFSRDVSPMPLFSAYYQAVIWIVSIRSE
jgi:hypothetical protein